MNNNIQIFDKVYENAKQEMLKIGEIILKPVEETMLFFFLA